jgi:hypothetical protein
MLWFLAVISWASTGFVVAVLFAVRLFAAQHGHRAGWGPGSYDRERQHVRMLANSGDPNVARTARSLLRVDSVAWFLMLPSGRLWCRFPRASSGACS